MLELVKFYALYFSSNKVHLTAIIQGTLHKLLLSSSLLFFINYHDYNYLLIQTLDISLSSDSLLSILDSWLLTFTQTLRRKNLHFSVIFKPRVMVWPLESNHDHSLCSRRSADWANYAAVKDKSEVMTKLQRIYSYSWTSWGLIL